MATVSNILWDISTSPQFFTNLRLYTCHVYGNSDMEDEESSTFFGLTLHTAHCTLHTISYIIILHIAHCKEYIDQCIMYQVVQCVLRCSSWISLWRIIAYLHILRQKIHISHYGTEIITMIAYHIM